MASAKQHKPQKCPICGSPTEHAYRPFCSSRCANVDLSRWLGGRYVIEGGTADEDEDGDMPRTGEDLGTATDDESSDR